MSSITTRRLVVVVFLAAVALFTISCGGNGNNCVNPASPGCTSVVEPPGPEQNAWDVEFVYWRQTLSWPEKFDDTPAGFLWPTQGNLETFYNTVVFDSSNQLVSSFFADTGESFEVSRQLPFLRFTRVALPVGTYTVTVDDLARVQLSGGSPVAGSDSVGDPIWVRARLDTAQHGWVKLTPSPRGGSQPPAAMGAKFQLTRKGSILQ